MIDLQTFNYFFAEVLCSIIEYLNKLYTLEMSLNNSHLHQPLSTIINVNITTSATDKPNNSVKEGTEAIADTAALAPPHTYTHLPHLRTIHKMWVRQRQIQRFKSLTLNFFAQLTRDTAWFEQLATSFMNAIFKNKFVISFHVEEFINTYWIYEPI